jgi:hypothetical protein
VSGNKYRGECFFQENLPVRDLAFRGTLNKPTREGVLKRAFLKGGIIKNPGVMPFNRGWKEM